ncbi:hypothetical protein BGZ99_000411 [Dissophora globulifera]|uniref:G-protein coupled receptors family 2 profile 2 domain-containing protein n=1 Tax=Dissophora globulifera TaxID=979702 RepID=A0A9P6R3J8_9FUNG|nr:hypothetical protein BGZ99_000411 [Dissophora globulifera]
MAQKPQRAAALTRLLCVALFVLLQSSIPTVSSATTTPAPTATTTAASAAITFLIPSATTINFILPSPAPAQPTSSTGNTAGNSTLGASCPPPLIPNVLNLTSGSCIGPCCIPCPVSSVFYEPNKLSDTYTGTSVLRAISAGASGFLSICYLILPSRRKHPHLIVLAISALTFPWEALGTAWLFKKDDLLCKSQYEIASISNSWLCGMQGTVLMYMVLVLVCLCILLICNLHVLTVYRSSFIQRHMTKLIVLSFFIPLSLVIPVVIRKQIENPGFGSICFVSSSAASSYFFYPLVITVCLAMMRIRANAGSSVSDSTSYNPDDPQQHDKPMSNRQRRLQTARDISLLLKQQWRPGLFAACLLVMDLTYCLFYFVEAKKLQNITPTTTWFLNWIQCLTQQAAIAIQSGQLSSTSSAAQLKTVGDASQKFCAAVAAPFVPSFAWAALSDILPAILGIVLLIIFGSKMELWHDIRRKFNGDKEEADFAMSDITMDSKNRQQRHRDEDEWQQQQQEQQQQQYQNRQGKQGDRLHSDEFQMDDNTYNSKDQMTPLPQAAARFGSNAQYGGDSRATSPPIVMPSIPVSSNIMHDDGLGYRGSIRKTSITIRDSREPIYYHNASQASPTPYQNIQEYQVAERQRQKIIHQQSQQRAQLVTEGSEPWPAWPSSSNSALPSSRHQAAMRGQSPLTVITTDDINLGFGNGRASPAPLSASASGTRVISPVSPGFYNSDDLVSNASYQDSHQHHTRQGSQVLGQVRGSPEHQQQQQRHQQFGHEQPPSGRELSPVPPAVPQKSRRRG